MQRLTTFRRRTRERRADQAGFTLIELTVSTGILMMVLMLATSVLLSTQNISKVVSFQSASNSDLRQLADRVFSDIETARPTMGCDTDNDGKANTTSIDTTCGTGASRYKQVERPDPILLVAGPNRLCYYTNRLQSRTSGATSANYNPPYVPVCLAVVDSVLRLETWPIPATDTTDWNQSLVAGDDPEYFRLGTVDPSDEGYFQYFQASSPTALTGSESIQITGTTAPDTEMLSASSRALVNSVLLRMRVKLGTSTADATRVRDVVYRVTLRATRYSAERCGLGNVDTGISCTTDDQPEAVTP